MADHDRSGRGRYGREDRGFTDRARDAVRSWVGDDEAARRRQMDERERDEWRREYHPRPEIERGQGWSSEEAATVRCALTSGEVCRTAWTTRHTGQ